MWCSRTRKTVAIYVLLLSGCVPSTYAQSSLTSGSVASQQFQTGSPSNFVNSHAVPVSNTFATNTFATNPQAFTNTQTFGAQHTGLASGFVSPQDFNGPLPSNGGGIIYPGGGLNHASKGFYPMSTMGGYYPSYPLNGQYWTGHQGQYYSGGHYYNPYAMQYPSQSYMGPPGQYMYPGQGQFNPWGYPQYGFTHSDMGFSNYYGQYPHFDANYWMGNMQPAMYMPHPGQMYPHHPAQYYHGYPMMYPGGHYAHYPPYPYHRKPFGRGFLGVSGGTLAKGVVGAVIAGLVVGKIARSG